MLPYDGFIFAASGLGNKLAANIGENAGDAEKRQLLQEFCLLYIVWLLVIAILKPLKRLSHGAEDLREKTFN